MSDMTDAMEAAEQAWTEHGIEGANEEVHLMFLIAFLSGATWQVKRPITTVMERHR
jgi:hypothetical protein